MFDVGWTEFLLVGVVALLVIGPKDLPKAMRVVGHWVGRMRGVARQFRAGFDNIVREAELEEMEKRWAAENARIMAAHPPSPVAELVHDTAATGEPAPVSAGPAAAEHDPFAVEPDASAAPVFVDQPQIRPAAGEPHAPPGAGVTS